MQIIYCGNQACRWSRERRGGTFEEREGVLLCADCIESRRTGEVKGFTCSPLWDFTTTHFNGEPIHVQGLKHLRQLEQQYGCSSHAANFMQKDWNTPPPVRTRPEGGQLHDMVYNRHAPIEINMRRN
jgi:hypothetical protein